MNTRITTFAIITLLSASCQKASQLDNRGDLLEIGASVSLQSESGLMLAAHAATTFSGSLHCGDVARPFSGLNIDITAAEINQEVACKVSVASFEVGGIVYSTDTDPGTVAWDKGSIHNYSNEMGEEIQLYLSSQLPNPMVGGETYDLKVILVNSRDGGVFRPIVEENVEGSTATISGTFVDAPKVSLDSVSRIGNTLTFKLTCDDGFDASLGSCEAMDLDTQLLMMASTVAMEPMELAINMYSSAYEFGKFVSEEDNDAAVDQDENGDLFFADAIQTAGIDEEGITYSINIENLDSDAIFLGLQYYFPDAADAPFSSVTVVKADLSPEAP